MVLREAQKQAVLDYVENFQEAHAEIQESMRRKDYASARKMLAECQEFAISLGAMIEGAEGEGHKTVSCLEEYCEALFCVHQEIDGHCDKTGNSINENKIFKTLRKHILRVENSVRNDIVSRKEVVFLPYKASMWDSMESVWMAADKEENSDVYVVVIPYYDKKPDGNPGQMHYEGDKFPDYVPVADWKSYRLPERKPDEIYIQNPYDDCNYVTCVHPQFFSRELKKYTNMLIYLPYFVGINNCVAEHLCTVPGVMNADKIFVQSKEVKDIYIKSIREYERQNHCKGIFGDLDKKIRLLDSPKLERLRRIMESGEIQVPEEWKDKVYLKDGTKKIIVLYNTTIDALLKHSDTYMEKLKSVLDIFRGEKKITLLWRPHPLLETTILAMRPDLHQQYTEIVDRYRREGWGIYDETADIDRAIVLSDAYYGDMSSVVEMYKVTGRPIMIQNCVTVQTNTELL